MLNKSFPLLLAGCVLAGLLSDALQLLAVPPEAEKHIAAAVANARRAVEAAELRLRLYERVEYPRKQRQLEAAIVLTAAEVERYRALLAEYKQISSGTIPDPLILTHQTTELALLETELKLRDLREENHLLMRYHSDQCRLHQLEVESAQAQLDEILSMQRNAEAH